MESRTQKINAIIAARKERGAAVAQIQQWMWNVRETLGAFRASLAESASGTPETETGKAAASFASRASAMEADLGAASAALEKVRAHFAKDTLAVAVVGQAGVGKSTFLQSLTGLNDSQIPAGGGRACTSTQSVIDNSPVGPGWAEVFYYDRRELLAILAGLYALIGWRTPTFHSMNEFAADFDTKTKPDSSSLWSLWRLLKTYRDHANDIERDIFGAGLRSRRIPIDDVASTVTYAEGESRPENLGIARVEIHCAFPGDDIGRISVVDTPGMNAASEERDKSILERVLDDTADFVLFVGIPAERGISKKEQEMFDTCRRCARQLSDAPLEKRAFYVANQAIVRDAETGEIRRNGADPKYNALWKQDFDAGVIPAAALIAVDAKNPSAVRDTVLDPMIDYLVQTLPELDAGEVATAEKTLADFRERVAAFADEARKTFGLDRTVDHDAYRKLRELFDPSFPHFSASLQSMVDAKTPSTHYADEDAASGNPFTKKVAEAFEKFRNDADASLDVERVKFEMSRNPGQGGAAFFNLLAFLRCRARDAFAAVEDACAELVEDAKRDVSAIFAAPQPNGGGFGGVSALRAEDGKPLDGSAFFGELAKICRMEGDSAPLAEQLEAFASFRLRFSGFLEHRVSAALSPLRAGSYEKYLSGKPDFTSAESIRASLLALGEEAANSVAIDLVEKSMSEPEQAVFAVLENFVDRTLRTEGMEKSWIALYETVRTEVWPEVFDPGSATNRTLFRLRSHVDALAQLARA